MSVFSPLFTSLGSLLTHLADVLDPVLGASATAGAIVVFTCAVRLALHPLTRSAVKGGQRRAELAPRLAELKRKHAKNPERLQQEMAELYRKEGTSPLAGCLPMLVQLPVFYVMYHLFSTGDGGGDLLKHTLLGAPLGGRWADALGDGGPVGAQGLVYLGLFVLVGAVATWTFLRNRKAAGDLPVPGAEDVQVPGMAAMAKVLPLLSFGTLVTAAVVPLAAGLYLVTTTTWSAVERAYLQPLGTAEKQAEPEGERQAARKALVAGKAQAAGKTRAAGKSQAVGKRRSSAA